MTTTSSVEGAEGTGLAVIDRVDIPSALVVAPATSLGCNEDSTLEQLAEMNNAVDFAYEKAKENKVARDGIFVAYIKKHGPFTLGDKRYWLTFPKSVKCRKLLDAIPAVMKACLGDEEAFVRALSINALKVGICRSLLGKDFDTHFVTVVKDKLESGEAAPMQLESSDPTFIKRK